MADMGPYFQDRVALSPETLCTQETDEQVHPVFSWWFLTADALRISAHSSAERDAAEIETTKIMQDCDEFWVQKDPQPPAATHSDLTL